jgi:hypothetical protein
MCSCSMSEHAVKCVPAVCQNMLWNVFLQYVRTCCEMCSCSMSEHAVKCVPVVCQNMMWNVFLQYVRTCCENSNKTAISTNRNSLLLVNVWELSMFPFQLYCSIGNVTFSASVNFWMQMCWTHWRTSQQTSRSCQSSSGSCAAVLQCITSPVILTCRKSAGHLLVWAVSSWCSAWGETQLPSRCKINTTWHSSVTMNSHSHDQYIWQLCH